MEKTDSVHEIHIEEPPLQRHEKNIYIGVVREHFVEIQRLRKNRYSFIQICGALVRDKKLPEDVKVRYFRQAFRRECLRQEKMSALAESDTPGRAGGLIL